MNKKAGGERQGRSASEEPNLLPVRLREAIAGFLATREAGSFSPRTLEGNRAALIRFTTWIETERDQLRELIELSPRVLEEYALWLAVSETAEGKRRCTGSRLNELGALRSLFRWLVQRGGLLADPSRDLPMPRPGPRMARGVLTLEEMERVLAVPDVATAMGMRDRAILELFYVTGMRNSELGALVLEDLDLGEGLVTIRRGKGGRGRVLPVGRMAGEELRRYLERGRPRFKRAALESYLFLTRRGVAMGRDSLSELMRRIGKTARLKKPLTCHGLRHTCATHLLRGRADIRHIQELLGHRSLQTTQLYTRVAASDLKQVLARCHPRERKR